MGDVVKTNWKKLGAAIALPLAVGASSALITKDSMIMFEVLKKPPLSPPSWLFPIAWTVLYILMGTASYIVLCSDEDNAQKRRALSYYALSLVFNFGWPILFFAFEKYLAAFVWLLVMWLFTLLATVRFYGGGKAAGNLMLPYILWTGFAGYLNYGIYLLN